MKKKVLLNLSNLSKGGGIQVGLSIIDSYHTSRKDIDFIVVCSKSVYELLNISTYDDSFTFIELDIQGSNLISQINGITKLKRIEKHYKPYGVITVFGPTFYRPKCLHLVGFAQGHLIDNDSPFWRITDLKTKFLFTLKKYVYKKVFLSTADLFHVESHFAKNKLAKYLHIKESRIVVANNYPHLMFNNELFMKKDKESDEDNFIISTISAYYPHKNLEIINKIVKIIEQDGNTSSIKFILTIDNVSFNKHFKKSSLIKNIGSVHGYDLLNLYSKTSALFLPSLLEIFPGNYLEAMKIRVPIITSNLDYAKNICDEAALYFNPLDEFSALNCIYKLINDDSIYQELQNKGDIQLKKFNNSIERANLILNKLINYQQ